MNQMKLANKKPLKCDKQEEKQFVNNNNVIMLYDVDLDGNVNFELAEILNKKNGKYKMLKTGEIRQYFPFVGYVDDNAYSYEEKFYEYGEETIIQHGINYEIIDRQDNIVFSNLYHMYMDRVSHMYLLKEYFRPHTCDYDGTRVYYASKIIFGKDINNRQCFSAFVYDEKGLFSKSQSSIEDWLSFENDINQLYKRYKSTGKNYVERNDKVIENQKKKYEQELKEIENRIHKDMNRQLKKMYGDNSKFKFTKEMNK